MAVKLSVLVLLLQYYTLTNAELGDKLPRTLSDNSKVYSVKPHPHKGQELNIADGRRPWKECISKPIRCPVCHPSPKVSPVHSTKYARALTEFLKIPISRGRSIDLRPYMRMFDFSTREEARILLTVPFSAIIDQYIESVSEKIPPPNEKMRTGKMSSRAQYLATTPDRRKAENLLETLQLQDDYNDAIDEPQMLYADEDDQVEMIKT